MSHSSTYLGIDPGLATIGYGVISVVDGAFRIVDFGILTTMPSLSFPERLLTIFRDIEGIVSRFRPDQAFVEELFFSSNTKTAMNVAHARGVILASLALQGLQVRSVTPNHIKLAITGDGNADKRQVQDMLCREFSLSSIPRPDDAADALAIAWYGGLASQREIL